MQEQILASVEEGIKAISFLKRVEVVAFIERAVEKLSQCFAEQGKVLIAGNGGSLCDAMHFAEELTGFYRLKRQALPAIALADSGHITCVANDIGYDFVFSRGVEALGQKGDVFIALTTSGNSINLKNGLAKAKEKGLFTIAFLGKTGGTMKGMADLELIIEGFAFSDRIQEAHMTVIHILIEMIERNLIGAPACQYSLHAN